MTREVSPFGYLTYSNQLSGLVSPLTLGVGYVHWRDIGRDYLFFTFPETNLIPSPSKFNLNSG